MNTSKFFNNNETTETGADFTGHNFDEFTGNEFDNFENDEFKNDEFENTEFAGGEFAEGEFNNKEFGNNEFVEDSFNGEFGKQEGKFERKGNMSDNFGSKFTTLILAIMVLTMSASTYRAASVSYGSYHEYNNNPAVEYNAGTYQDRANAAYTADRNSYSYKDYNNAKNADYSYAQHPSAEYDPTNYQDTSYAHADTYKGGDAYHDLDYTATGHSYDSRLKASVYENIRDGYNVYDHC